MCLFILYLKGDGSKNKIIFGFRFSPLLFGYLFFHELKLAMHFKRNLFFTLFLVATTLFAQERELSPLSKISLLTVGIADELQSKFGHTAIRVQDATNGMDIVFGYGGFDFKAPFFYFKFTTGKLDYSMTGSHYNNFLASYKIENRWVLEQQLNLTLAQRNQLFDFLENNYKEENRNYKYDFLFDNCATKVPEVFKAVYSDDIEFNYDYLKKTATFRQLIHETLQTNSWATFGIDLALGSVIDREATPWEHQFLPLYVKEQFKHISINGKPIVKDEELVLKNKPISKNTNFLLSPLFWLLVLLILVVSLSYLDFKKEKRSRWLDFILFFMTGMAGLIICFLWFATNHSSTKMNFNILWAFPLNLVVAFVLLKKKAPASWVSNYLWALIALNVITILLWVLKIQVFSPLIILILLALEVRYLFLIHYRNTPHGKLNQ